MAGWPWVAERVVATTLTNPPTEKNYKYRRLMIKGISISSASWSDSGDRRTWYRDWENSLGDCQGGSHLLGSWGEGQSAISGYLAASLHASRTVNAFTKNSTVPVRMRETV